MTTNSDCTKLDVYLADDLPVDKALRFESHLEECGACREAIDEQNWVDGLLQSPARIQLERAPTEILDSFRSSLSQRRRRVLQFACSLAAAAVLVVAICWLELNRQARLPSVSEGQDVAIAEPVRAATRIRPQATFIASSDAIVVPLENPSTDVTVVQVYQTTDAERRWRLERTLSTKPNVPNGG